MSGRAHALDLVPGLRELATTQRGVVRRDQLRSLGVLARHVRHQVDAQRWTTYGPHVVVLKTGQLSRDQRFAAAVLHVGSGAALAGRSALELRGLRAWQCDPVHVVAPVTSTPTPLRGVVVHRSRNLGAEDLVVGAWPACTVPARAAVDAASWEPTERSASGLVLAVVQQRLARVEELMMQLERPGPVKHRALLRDVLRAASGGADALSEMDVARLVRRAGLPEPRRQVVIATPEGRRRVDLAVDLPDGRVLIIEVDGPQHADPRVREDDAVKDAALVAAGYVVLRIPVTLLRRSPGTVLSQLQAIADAARGRVVGST